MTATVVAARLRELLDYDATTGVFKWRIGRRRVARAGSVAGTQDSDGYIKIRISGRAYKAHRLAWFYVNGVWPTLELDHINQVKTDNRISNLREVSRSENNQNKLTQRTNSSGYRGVSRHKRGDQWQARIKLNGKERYLGIFDTPEQASAAYEAAAAELHSHRPVN